MILRSKWSEADLQSTKVCGGAEIFSGLAAYPSLAEIHVIDGAAILRVIRANHGNRHYSWAFHAQH
jgi:hypothetical protein